MRGAWGRAWGGTEHTEPPGKGQKGELWGTQDWGYGAGQRTPPPGIRAPPAARRAPPLMQRLLATARWGTTAKGGCSSAPPRGWHRPTPHPITAPAVGQQEKRGCGGGLCPNWGRWAQSSWDPPQPSWSRSSEGDPKASNPKLLRELNSGEGGEVPVHGVGGGSAQVLFLPLNGLLDAQQHGGQPLVQAGDGVVLLHGVGVGVDVLLLVSIQQFLHQFAFA